MFTDILEEYAAPIFGVHMKKEPACSTKISIIIYQTTQHHNPGDGISVLCHEKLKSKTVSKDYLHTQPLTH
jgi:hypothetical protein